MFSNPRPIVAAVPIGRRSGPVRAISSDRGAAVKRRA
jgi:hypothetical protein